MRKTIGYNNFNDNVDKRQNKMVLIIIFINFFIILTRFSIVNASDTLTNSTRAYFYSEIESGDCVLLENYDKNGNKRYGLIDAGIQNDENGNAITSVKTFLEYHNVTELEFLLITHNHSDHIGDAIAVLDNFSVKTIYINAFDKSYVTDQNSQDIYENIIERAVAKNIKVIGVSYGAIKSHTISPSLTDIFMQNTQNAKQSNFIEFNSNNTKFSFGSSQIQIFNWEVFDTKGNQLYIKQSSNNIWEYQTIDGIASSREIVDNDNNNSLGLLLTQGNNKAFFAGDINNLDEDEINGRIGDEDRIKDKIGDIDLLKLGHHGNTQSNTLDYINVLKPEYAIITNKLGRASKEISDWMNEKNVNYLYSTQDIYEISATITNSDVNLGLGTEDVINKIDGTLYYVPEGSKYKDYKEYLYEIEYQEKNVDVNSWEQLKTAIRNNINNRVSINDINKTFTLYELVVNLKNGGDWTANSTINIEEQQKVVLNSSENITVLRGINLKDSPLFLIRGNLSIGKQNMTGKIIVDGNKTNVTSTCALLRIEYGDLNMYDNVKLCNNFNKATQMTSQTGATYYYVPFGSGIYSVNGRINIYGGEIINNSQKINYTLELPEETIRYYELCTMGAGIYMESNSILNMYGGVIAKNLSSNCSTVKTKSTYTNAKINRGIKQQCLGVGIYANRNSEINLIAGEIKQNSAINDSSLQLITPTTNGKITNIYTANNSIYGVGIYASLSNVNISEEFKILNNNATQNSQILLQKNTKIKGNATSSIRGLNAYIDTSNINITGGEISGGTSISNSDIINNGSIGNNETGSVSTLNLGGGLNINNCLNANIKNIDINNCTSDRGGAIYINLSDVTLSNSNISQNKAIHGGGLFISGNTSRVNIINSKINNNTAITESGGGIYTYGNLKIEGENTEISNNEAEKAGGGIRVNSNGELTINGGKITNNISNGTGGGIHVDGKLTINEGIITSNSARTNGGGIYYKNGVLTKNGGILINNTAKNEGNNIFPLNDDILDETAPKVDVSYSITEKTNQNVKVTITANEEIQEITGWTLSQDKKILSKSYDENTQENIDIKDLAGNEIIAKVSIANIDKIAPKADVSYSITEKTNQNVKVTITANEEIQEITGWTLSQDKKILSKSYNENTQENVVIKDLAGNETIAKISIANIDKTAPKADVSYSITEKTNQNVKVTITANEEIQEITGWTLSQDKKILSKSYNENTQENVVIKDLAGNETIAKVSITNIEKTIGDINTNETIDIGDILLLKRYMAYKNSKATAERHVDWNLNDEKIILGDVNKNGVIDIGDILKLQRFIAAKNSQEVAKKHSEWLKL